MKLNTIIDNSPIPTWITDREGTLISINESLLEHLNVRKVDVIGKYNLLKDQNLVEQNLISVVKEVFQKKKSVRFVMQWFGSRSGYPKLADSNNPWIDVAVSPVLDNKGNITHVVGQWIDITSQKEVEKELLKSESRYRKAQEVGHIGSWEYNIKTNEFWGSDEGKRIYNLNINKKEFPAEEVMNCVVEEDRDMVNQAMIDLIEQDKNYDIVFTIIPKNTSTRKIIHSIAEIERDEKNNPLKVTGVLQDITLQKQTEEALVKAKEQAEENDFRLKLAIESGELGIWDRDLKDDTLVWNKRMFELYGIAEKDFTGKIDNWKNKIYIDDRERVVAESNAAIHNKKEYNTTFRVVHPDGKIIYIKADGKIICDEQDNPIRMIGINRDVTEIVNYQNELIKAKEKAEEADRLKSAFLANMSHEIRTPMNGILGFTSLLKEPGLDGVEQKKYIEIIQKSGERMLNTVNDIVEISKIDAGQIKINYNEINISNHLLTLKDFFNLDLSRKGLKLVVKNRLSAEEEKIVTDKSKVSSILTNLIKNAIKFADKGEITIECKRKDQFIEFSVSDEGIGIPADRIEAIFNRFEQADIGDSRAFEGTGLGLAITKSYVEMLGGRIWVKSEKNKGSTFYFTIQHNMDKSLQPDSDNQLTRSSKIPKIGEINILIAEDDEVSKLHLEIILKEISKKVIFVESGLDAVQKVKEEADIDVVLMDIRMPTMDGLTATKKIRSLNKDVIIIAQTAFALEGDRQRALDAGCDDYITKPFNKKDLISLIETHIKKLKD